MTDVVQAVKAKVEPVVAKVEAEVHTVVSDVKSDWVKVSTYLHVVYGAVATWAVTHLSAIISVVKALV